GPAADDHDAHLRSPLDRRRDGRGLPPDREDVPRGAGPRVVTVWYHVRDLDEGRRFYRDALGFTETSFDVRAGWARLHHGEMEIGLAQGEPHEDGGVAHVDVRDLKAEA